MTMKSEAWQAHFIESLEDASDIGRQRAAWIDLTNTQFPCTPVELMCQLFDDSAINDLLEKGVVFSETTDTALRRLHALANLVPGSHLDVLPERLLSSRAWIEFTREAARVLALVRADLGL